MRAAFAAAVLAAALAREPDGAVALISFAVGALGAVVVLVNDPRGARIPPEPLPFPAGARRAAPLATVARGLLPSTAGVAALGVAALAFEAPLAALLAGVLLGMAAAGLLSWWRIAALERAAAVELFVEERARGRVFARERDGHDPDRRVARRRRVGRTGGRGAAEGPEGEEGLEVVEDGPASKPAEAAARAVTVRPEETLPAAAGGPPRAERQRAGARPVRTTGRAAGQVRRG